MRKELIIIAEESATQAEILTFILEHQGYSVLHGENGKEAFKLAKKNPPALFISDIIMPEMDGYELCVAIKAEPSLQEIPVLLLTTLSSPKDLIRGLQAGAESYLVKPYDEGELLEWVEKLLHPQKPSGTSFNPRLENFLVSTYQTAMQKNKELRKAKEIAEQADRLKSAFLNNLSHEIRTPMNAILGFSTFIGDPDITPQERAEFAGHIETGCANLLGIIDSIVDLSVIESENIEPNITECRINPFLESIRDEFTEKEKHQMDNLLFRFLAAKKDDQFAILIDQARTKKVLNNLLKNALKFTESGFIEFGYTLDTPGFIELFVRDSGTGIPRDKIHLIFDKFIKLEEFHTKKYSGTGVGLTITKKLVEFLGGSIRVKSAVGEGSEFTVSLPLTIPDALKEKIPPTAEKKTGEALNWSNRRILVAEDVESNFQLIEHLLKKTHVEILWAKNGKEAVDMCSNGRTIDLILMDIQMPVMDGYAAAEQILKMGKGIPIMAQTAYALSHDEEHVLAAGFSDLLTKPIQAAELMKKITRIFEK
ncbi:MAG: response regulator [Bacteroidia bacterium]|nr:response regulator [Bacteroidia bacterium]